MEITYFHRKKSKTFVSIEENFRPLIEVYSQNHNVHVYSVPYDGSNPINLFKNIMFIRKYSTKKGVNHITGDIHYGILGLLGRKSVLSIMDDYTIRKSSKGRIGKFYKWLFWIYLPIKFADVVACISPTTRTNIYNLYHSNKLRIITHQIVPKALIEISKPFNKECPRILQIGTEPNKNLETTLEALKGYKCKLVVLKPMTEDQKRTALRYKIDYENMYGLPYEEVIKEYQKCDIVLFPSLYEGLGVPIFEGQAAGKPVITTNREPMNWVAGDGAALLNNPKDSTELLSIITKIVKDDQYRISLIDRGRKNSQRFSLESAVESYYKVYKEVLNN